MLSIFSWAKWGTGTTGGICRNNSYRTGTCCDSCTWHLAFVLNLNFLSQKDDLVCGRVFQATLILSRVYRIFGGKHCPSLFVFDSFEHLKNNFTLPLDFCFDFLHFFCFLQSYNLESQTAAIVLSVKWLVILTLKTLVV